MFKSILVLCTGNICRSPIAEAMLREKLPGVSVISAGTGAMVGHAADPTAVQVARAVGLDIAAHRAQQALTPLLKGADLVLVMTREHLDWVHGQIPALRGRVHLLGRWRDLEVDDPYGGDQAAFERSHEQISDCVADWLPKLG